MTPNEHKRLVGRCDRLCRAAVMLIDRDESAGRLTPEDASSLRADVALARIQLTAARLRALGR